MTLIALTPVQSTRLLLAARAVLDAPRTGAKRIEAERLLGDCLLDVNGAPFMFAGPLSREGAEPYPHEGIDPVVTEARKRLDEAFAALPEPCWVLGGYEEYENGFGARVVYIDPEDPTLAILVDENPEYIRYLRDGKPVRCYHPAQAIVGRDGKREDWGWTYVTPDEDGRESYLDALKALADFKAWIAEDAAKGEAEAAANG